MFLQLSYNSLADNGTTLGNETLISDNSKSGDPNNKNFLENLQLTTEPESVHIVPQKKAKKHAPLVEVNFPDQTLSHTDDNIESAHQYKVGKVNHLSFFSLVFM